MELYHEKIVGRTKKHLRYKNKLEICYIIKTVSDSKTPEIRLKIEICKRFWLIFCSKNDHFDLHFPSQISLNLIFTMWTCKILFSAKVSIRREWSNNLIKNEHKNQTFRRAQKMIQVHNLLLYPILRFSLQVFFL